MIIKVVLLALQVRGAMGEYLELLSRALSRKVDLYVFAPEHFEYNDLGTAKLHTFKTGKTRKEAFLTLLNPLGGLRVWGAISETIPDVIHLLNGEGYPWALMWASLAIASRIPFVVTVHDPEPHPGSIWDQLNATTRSIVIRKASSVHVHSTMFIEKIRHIGAKSVISIPHGSFAPLYLPYARENVKKEDLVLFFGRLEPYKGLDVLIEAGLILNGRFKIAIAGPGVLPKHLEITVQQRNDIFELYNRFLTRAEVANLFQRASVCVLPYRQATQSSLPLLSAAFGVPVVASALGAFLEDVPRVGGLLTTPGDANELARRIIEASKIKPHYPQELEFERLAERFVQWYASTTQTKGVSPFGT